MVQIYASVIPSVTRTHQVTAASTVHVEVDWRFGPVTVQVTLSRRPDGPNRSALVRRISKDQKLSLSASKATFYDPILKLRFYQRNREFDQRNISLTKARGKLRNGVTIKFDKSHARLRWRNLDFYPYAIGSSHSERILSVRSEIYSFNFRDRHRDIKTRSFNNAKVGVPSAVPDARDAEYTVWYGTNREPAASGIYYSSERAGLTRFGRCRVFVPKSHAIGSIGSPWWKRLFLGDDRLKLLTVDPIRSADFYVAVSSHLSSILDSERQVVVFLHGYNVTFVQAALQAAQIGFDLSVRGAMAFFSWPSQGTLDGYMADEAAIEASEFDIQNFIEEIVQRSYATSVHIIAHSMGNRALLRVVERITTRLSVRFGQIVLAAPDVDTDAFQTLAHNYPKVSTRTTLYVSSKDKAVGASHWLHRSGRVGLTPPVFVMNGIDTISVENVDMTMLGHGYISSAREVLTDIHALIKTGAAPDTRFGLERRTVQPSGHYWQFRR